MASEVFQNLSGTVACILVDVIVADDVHILRYSSRLSSRLRSRFKVTIK